MDYPPYYDLREPVNPGDSVHKGYVDKGVAAVVVYVDDQIVSVTNDLTSKADSSYVDAQISGRSAVGHTHAQSEVTNLVSDLAAKSNTGHTHPQSDVTNLVSALAGKSATGHTHIQSEIINLVSDLAGKAASVHTHAGLPILFRVTADTANSSNSSFTNLFSQAVLAGEVWSFEAIIYYSVAATTTGIVMQADSPASPAASQISMWTLEGPTVIRNLTGAQGVALVGTAGLTTVLETRISGTIEAGATPGNIVVKFRSEVNASAVTVKRGSWARFYKH